MRLKERLEKMGDKGHAAILLVVAAIFVGLAVFAANSPRAAAEREQEAARIAAENARYVHASAEHAILHTPMPYEEAAPTFAEHPQETPIPTVTPEMAPPPVPGDIAAQPIPSGSATAIPQEAEEAFGVVTLDLDGSGTENVVALNAGLDTNGNVLLEIDGRTYATGVVPGSVSTTFYAVDIHTGDGISELMIVAEDEGSARLHLFRIQESGLVSALFHYTLPAELSDANEEEEHTQETSLVFRGLEPIVILGDGSFAVLSYGQGFTRYALNDGFEVSQAGTLGLDILRGGEVPPLGVETAPPVELPDPNVESVLQDIPAPA